MALSRVTTWSSAQILTASALNGEFNNILDNALSLISPLTGNLDFNGNRLLNLAAGTVGSPGVYFTSDADTGVYSSGANNVDIAVGGVRALNLQSVTGASAFARIGHTSATQYEAVIFEALGTPTNIAIRVIPKGSGYVQVFGTARTVGQEFLPRFAFNDSDTGFVQTAAGVIDVLTSGRRAAQFRTTGSATNYLQITPSSTGNAVDIAAVGGDTNIGLSLTAKGSGTITAATAFIPAAHTANGTPPAHAVVRDNVIKAWINFKGTATASIYGSYNITSLSHPGNGNYVITWDRDFTATPYAIIGMGMATSTTTAMPIVMIDEATPPALGSVTIDVRNQAGTQTDFRVMCVLAVGPQ